MKDEICEAVRKDLGRSAFQTFVSEVNHCQSEIAHSIGALKGWMKDTVVNTPIAVGPAKSYIRAEPLGVVLIMSSWNFPLYTLLGPA